MSQVYSIFRQSCGPSGHEHAISLRLTPACLTSTSSIKVIRNLVLAKGNSLQVYDVCVEQVKPQANGHVNGTADEVSCRVIKVAACWAQRAISLRRRRHSFICANISCMASSLDWIASASSTRIKMAFIDCSSPFETQKCAHSAPRR
jgi:hypothetical protein